MNLFQKQCKKIAEGRNLVETNGEKYNTLLEDDNLLYSEYAPARDSENFMYGVEYIGVYYNSTTVKGMQFYSKDQSIHYVHQDY